MMVLKGKLTQFLKREKKINFITKNDKSLLCFVIISLK